MFTQIRRSKRTVRVGMRFADGELLLDGQPVFFGDSLELVHQIATLVERKLPTMVVTPNVDIVLEMIDNGEFRQAVGAADLRVIDGAPLVLLSKLLGATSAVRITGADALPYICRESITRAWRVVIMGGAPGVSDRAATNIRKRLPGADLHSVSFPTLANVADLASLEVIRDLQTLAPDVVFICLGAPKQELWFSKWKGSLPAAVYIGAGAAVDFQAGLLRRAPELVQRLGLEWVWRLMQEPRRLGPRYLVRGPRFVGVVWRSLAYRHRSERIRYWGAM